MFSGATFSRSGARVRGTACSPVLSRRPAPLPGRSAHILQIFPHTHFPDFTEAILCIGDIRTPVSRVLHADPSACVLLPQVSCRSKRIETDRAFGPEWDLVEVERRSEKP
jgi:hypothetical protein